MFDNHKWFRWFTFDRHDCTCVHCLHDFWQYWYMYLCTSKMGLHIILSNILQCQCWFCMHLRHYFKLQTWSIYLKNAISNVTKICIVKVNQFANIYHTLLKAGHTNIAHATINQRLCSHLPPEKRVPLAAPNVENATKIGIIQLTLPRTASAHVCG